MSSKKRVSFTPKQLKQWESVRQDLTSQMLLNPRTNKPIKRGGPTFWDLEEQFSSYTERRGRLQVNEAEAAAPTPKMNRVLAAVLEHSAHTGDRRTAAKIGMLNKELHADFLAKMPPTTEQSKGIMLSRKLVRDMVHQAIQKYNEPHSMERLISRNARPLTVESKSVPDNILDYIAHILKQKMEELRNITRHRKKSTLVRPNELPRSPETVDVVVKKFKRMFLTLDDLELPYMKVIVKHDVLDAWENYDKPSGIEKQLVEVLKRAYDIPDDIAAFYAVFLAIYGYRLILKYL